MKKIGNRVDPAVGDPLRARRQFDVFLRQPEGSGAILDGGVARLDTATEEARRLNDDRRQQRRQQSGAHHRRPVDAPEVGRKAHRDEAFGRHQQRQRHREDAGRVQQRQSAVGDVPGRRPRQALRIGEDHQHRNGQALVAHPSIFVFNQRYSCGLNKVFLFTIKIAVRVS